jgi:uncharacterized protein with HEPN domain
VERRARTRIPVEGRTSDQRSAPGNARQRHRAIARSLNHHTKQHLGEAVRYLPDPLKSSNPDIPWVTRTAVRIRIVHGYFGIDDSILFTAIEQDLKPCYRALRRRRARMERICRKDVGDRPPPTATVGRAAVSFGCLATPAVQSRTPPRASHATATIGCYRQPRQSAPIPTPP